MGTFSRISNVVRAEVDEVLNKLEDPKKMVRQMVLDMEAALDDAVIAVGQAMANEKLLSRRIVQKQDGFSFVGAQGRGCYGCWRGRTGAQSTVSEGGG